MPRAAMILILPMIAGIDAAAAFNTFDYFTKKPTFEPPENCAPTETNYGVTAQCETKFQSGGYFWATIDTAVAWYQERTPEDAKEFARGHVAEAKQGWIDSYPGKKVNFSSAESPIKPPGAPGIACFRYSISVDDARDEQANVVWNTKVEGLACAWPVENPPPTSNRSRCSGSKSLTSTPMTRRRCPVSRSWRRGSSARRGCDMSERVTSISKATKPYFVRRPVFYLLGLAQVLIAGAILPMWAFRGWDWFIGLLVVYVAIFALVVLGYRHPLSMVRAYTSYAPTLGLAIFGLGGRVAHEIAAAAGAPANDDAKFILVTMACGLGLGTLMGMPLIAFLSAGLGNRRNGSYIAGLLLLPAIPVSVAISPPVAAALGTGLPLLNYALMIVLVAFFGRVVFPGFKNVLIREELANAKILERLEKLDEEGALEQAFGSDALRISRRRITDQRMQLDPGIIARAPNGIGVALSGGGHRAALFNLGVLHYLARCGKNKEISQIASVSGGSMTNGFVARSLDFRHATLGEFEKVAARLAQQIADHGSMFAGWFPKIFLVAFGACGLGFLLVTISWQWDFAFLPPVLKSPFLALALLMLTGVLFRGRGWLARRAFEKILFMEGRRRMSMQDLNRDTLHVFCATELQTGAGAYFFNAHRDPNQPRPNPRSCRPMLICEPFEGGEADHPLKIAVGASAAVSESPGLKREPCAVTAADDADAAAFAVWRPGEF